MVKNMGVEDHPVSASAGGGGGLAHKSFSFHSFYFVGIAPA